MDMGEVLEGVLNSELRDLYNGVSSLFGVYEFGPGSEVVGEFLGGVCNGDAPEVCSIVGLFVGVVLVIGEVVEVEEDIEDIV